MKVSQTASLFVICLGVAHALNCYTCDSLNQGYCADPFHKPSQNQEISCSQSFNQVFSSFKSHFTEESNEEKDLCVKIIHKDPATGLKLKVERGCVSGHYDNVCKFLSGNLGNAVECYTCKNNLCNGATSVNALAAAAVALASIFVALKL